MTQPTEAEYREAARNVKTFSALWRELTARGFALPFAAITAANEKYSLGLKVSTVEKKPAMAGVACPKQGAKSKGGKGDAA